jgi:hypothetical protein
MAGRVISMRVQPNVYDPASPGITWYIVQLDKYPKPIEVYQFLEREWK